MKKKSNFNYSKMIHNPTQKEAIKMADTVFSLQDKLIYRKLKSGRYQTYCMCCGDRRNIDAYELKQIQAAHLCPSCFRKIKTGSKQNNQVFKWVGFRSGNEIFGYDLWAEKTFWNKPIIRSIKQVLYANFETMEFYRKDCVKGMYYQLNHTITDGWRPCSDDYLNYFYDVEIANNYLYKMSMTKKQYYEERYAWCDYQIKSNQKRMMEENLMNTAQIDFMLAFNLKDMKEVLKYKKYIDSHGEIMTDRRFEKPLNIYYLDYLSRNNISYHDFCDYEYQCEKLKRKLDKPRDFNKTHSELAELIKLKENQKYQKLISKRLKEYSKYSYARGEIKIIPFGSAKEIIDCGKKLHNCIGTYVEKYAHKKTMLFYMIQAEKLVAAIEVKNNKLIQARTAYNQNCDTKQKRIINSWCKKNGWRYANGY